jgi:glycosyltransferase involved in cell wall biosynthesis
MKIVHLLNHVKEIGNGIVNTAIDLACLQAQAGHTVAIASAGGEYEALLQRYGVQHVTLNQARRPTILWRAVQGYRQLLQTFDPDIVHTHMMTGVVLAKGLRYGHRYKLIATVHNEFQRSAILMGLADGVIAVSQAVADAMARRGIPVGKLRVVRNGTIGSLRPPASETAKVLHHHAITTVAGLYHRKGVADLITAFNLMAHHVPEVHLYVVGNGPNRAEFEAQAQQTAVASRIHFEGFQPDPQGYLRGTDIFVLASRQEPFGLVLSEAREAGCAIVATDVGGIPEALDYGRAGMLVPPRQPGALAKALTQLCRHPEQLKGWQKQAQTNLDWLSVQRVCSETQAVYEEFL